MTDLRTYRYISKTKLGVLEAQLRRRWKWVLEAPTPAGGRAVLESHADPQEGAGDLVRRAEWLTKKMRQKHYIVPLDHQDGLVTSTYYEDKFEWFEGLYAFQGDISLEAGTTQLVSYLLWRRWRNSIILLAGSPENVLGERVVRDGVWAYGTTGTWGAVKAFAERNLRTDEWNVVGVSGVSSTEEGSEFPWIEWDAGSLPDDSDTSPQELWAVHTPRALALATLCVGYLAELPQRKINSTFQITDVLDLALSGQLPDWVETNLAAKHRGNELFKLIRGCEKVYLGSPLHTWM